MNRFGILGKELDPSRVRRIHSALGDYEYVLLDCDSEEDIPRLLKDTRIDGFSVARPYKTAVIKYLDEISEDAERTQCVNTVKILPDGRLKGFNTMIDGFKYTAADSVEGRKCLVLGSGGAARSIAEGLDDMGASEVVLVSRDPEAASEKPGNSGRRITGYDKLHQFHDAQLIINCTPVGACPDVSKSPLGEARVSARMFYDLEMAIDTIYDPYRTKFLQDARRLTGCNTKSGLDMLIIQVLATRNIWLDIEPDPEEEERLLRQIKRRILESQLNVVAVGLPGSGKTTIFRRYAYELGLKFIDTDEETEKIMGQPISEVLSSSGVGEEYFRASEHQAVLDTASVKGSVIATGGGTLLNPVNRDILKSNGIVIYIKRPIDLLNIKGKPLGLNINLTQLFNDRDRIYRRVSDVTLINSRIFGEVKARTGEGNSYNYELKGFVYFIARKVQKYLNELAANRWT